MKNKFLIGLITVFAAIFTSILILNFSTSSSNKDNYFDRKFSKNEILKWDKDFGKLNKNSQYEMYYSNTSIVEGMVNGNEGNKMNYIFYFSDGSFLSKENKNVKLPLSSNILLVDKNCIIYSFNAKLYRLELKTNRTIETNIKNVDISFLTSLENDSNKYLFFGEIFKDDTYKTGFFILDILNNKIIESKVLKSNAKSFSPEIIVMHSGYFQKAYSNSINYICDKNSKIFLFDSKGIFLKEVNTKDDTPLPKVIKKDNNYSYSRNGLRFSNAGLFMDNKNVFVFSMASDFNDKIIIDQYSKLSMEYIQSFKLDYNNHKAKDIQNVFIDNNKVILKFESNYASFKFSRYY